MLGPAARRHAALMTCSGLLCNLRKGLCTRLVRARAISCSASRSAASDCRATCRTGKSLLLSQQSSLHSLDMITKLYCIY